jgi:HEAT repeat protein
MRDRRQEPCVVAALAVLLAACHEPTRAAGPPQRHDTPTMAKTTDELVDAFVSAPSFWEQNEVAKRIVASGDRAVVAKLEAHLQDADRRRRCNAGFVLAGLGDPRGLDVILRELEDKSPRAAQNIRSDGSPDVAGQITADRYFAAVLLGELKDARAVPALIDATGDDKIDYAAAIALGHIGDQRAAPALRKMASGSERLWAAYGLAGLGDDEGVDMLAEILRSSKEWTARRHAADALGEFARRRGVPTLVTALSDAHTNVRVSAARALGLIGDPAALEALRGALTDTAETEVNAPTTVAAEARNAIDAILARKR